jgi:hypothetical protein
MPSMKFKNNRLALFAEIQVAVLPEKTFFITEKCIRCNKLQATADLTSTSVPYTFKLPFSNY